MLRHFGDSPQITNVEEPTVADGKRVKVAAVSIKQLDRAIAGGTHYASPRALPIIPGTDAVGWLDDRLVYFSTEHSPFGSMAEWSIASWSVPLPDDLDPSVAAAIVNPALGA